MHRVDEFEGIGIGLANMRRIITRYGGRSIFLNLSVTDYIIIAIVRSWQTDSPYKDRTASKSRIRRLFPVPNNDWVSIRKGWIDPEFKADGEFEPEEYIEYFEDSNSPPNAVIGCKMPFPNGYDLGDLYGFVQ